MNDDDCCVSVTRREGRVAAGLAPWTLIGNGSTVAANDLRRRAGHHPSSLEQHSPRRIRSLFCSQNKQTGSSSPLYTSRHVLIPAARPFRRRWPHPSCSSTASSYHARFEPRPKLFDWLTGFLLIYSTFFRRRTHPNGPCPRHSSQKIVISLSLFIWHPPLLWHEGKLALSPTFLRVKSFRNHQLSSGPHFQTNQNAADTSPYKTRPKMMMKVNKKRRKKEMIKELKPSHQQVDGWWVSVLVSQPRGVNLMRQHVFFLLFAPFLETRAMLWSILRQSRRGAQQKTIWRCIIKVHQRALMMLMMPDDLAFRRRSGGEKRRNDKWLANPLFGQHFSSLLRDLRIWLGLWWRQLGGNGPRHGGVSW